MNHIMNRNPMYTKGQAFGQQISSRKPNEDLMTPIMPLKNDQEIYEQNLITEYLQVQNYESQQAYLDEIRNRERAAMYE